MKYVSLSIVNSYLLIYHYCILKDTNHDDDEDTLSIRSPSGYMFIIKDKDPIHNGIDKQSVYNNYCNY